MKKRTNRDYKVTLVVYYTYHCRVDSLQEAEEQAKANFNDKCFDLFEPPYIAEVNGIPFK